MSSLPPSVCRLCDAVAFAIRVYVWIMLGAVALGMVSGLLGVLAR